MQVTWIAIKDGSKILLGLKKRGFGAGKWNGFGGKVQENETVADSARHELKEESGIEALEMHAVGKLNFTYNHTAKHHECTCYLVTKYSGEPVETEEMQPKWFEDSEIPYEQMWVDDQYWLPIVLKGKKVQAKFVFDSYSNIIDKEVIEI